MKRQQQNINTANSPACIQKCMDTRRCSTAVRDLSQECKRIFTSENYSINIQQMKDKNMFMATSNNAKKALGKIKIQYSLMMKNTQQIKNRANFYLKRESIKRIHLMLRELMLASKD